MTNGFWDAGMGFPIQKDAISIERNGAEDDRNVEYLSPKIRTPRVENCRKVIRNFKLQNFKKILLSSPLQEIKSKNMPWRGKV